MTLEEYLLECLSEECAEIIQRVCKAKRFGLEESQEGQALCNEERISQELNDLYAVLDLLHDNHVVATNRNEGMIKSKKIKLKKYMAYSRDLGILQAEAL